MSIHFSAANCAVKSHLSSDGARSTMECAANDNGLGAPFDQMLHAALRHFAQHGIGAARDARKRAETAFFTGDSESYQWWLGVCRVIDRRLADELARLPAPHGERVPIG